MLGFLNRFNQFTKRAVLRSEKKKKLNRLVESKALITGLNRECNKYDGPL